jgi:NAD(P)-dependent dehydrogenase (short-subunit alcohol dehydrogenase family)
MSPSTLTDMAARTALVTGATRGIGKAVAQALVERGWQVVGTCRAPRRLAAEDRLPGVRYEPLDLAVARSVEKLARSLGAIDLLVSNAGESPVGPAEEIPPERLAEHFQVNLFAPVRFAQAVLPGMRERRRGTIVFIGSIRGEIATPFSSAYAASKAAVRLFAESMGMEVRSYGVRVCVVSPWYVRTTLPQELLARPRSPYSEALGRVKAKRDMAISGAQPPEEVARAVLALVSSANPAPFTIVGKPFLTFLLRHMPRRLVTAATARTVGLTTS